MIMDSDGEERWRLEGYLPRDEFQTDLEMGLARVAFMSKNWPEAIQRYSDVARQHPDSKFAPQAVYYGGVSRYSSSHDGAELANTAKELAEKYPETEWQLRSIPWAKE